MVANTRSNSSAKRLPGARNHEQQAPVVVIVRAARARSGSGGDEDAAAAARDPPTSSTTPAPAALILINRATKYAVSLAVVLAVCAAGASPRACWDVAGAVASSAANKALKRLLNHSRPEGAPKADPGMPSSHANSLAFLAATAALEVWRVGGGGGGGTAAALSAALLALGAFLSWLRVRLGFHTPEQVIAGCAFGSVCAVGWHALAPSALEALTVAAGGSEEAAAGLLKGIGAAAGVAFALGNARGWIPEAKGMLTLVDNSSVSSLEEDGKEDEQRRR
jgi:dolichyldiphosphatase